MVNTMKRRDKIILTALFSFVILLLFTYGGCGSKGSSNSNPVSGNPNQVIMKNIAFNPASLTVNAGTTVTWINNDNMDHTVTSGTPGKNTGVFDSGTIAPSGKFNFTFNTKGTYQYYCTLHPTQMQATIVVQ